MGSWEAQRTLRGPDGSWRVLRCPRSNDGVFRGPEAVLRWFWGVLVFLGVQGSKESWGILLDWRGPAWLWGFLRSHRGLRGEDISSKVHHNPVGPFRTSQNPFDPSGTLGLHMTPCETFNPSVAFRTHQPHRTHQDPSGPPQDRFRTTEYRLSTPETPQNLSGPIRTPQGPLSLSGSHIMIC